MAIRPVFEAITDPNDKALYREVEIEFKWYPGLSVIQRRRSIVSLQQTYLETHPESKVIEVSTKALNQIGAQFSPFNLTYRMEDGREIPVETVYSASKFYTHAGPFPDILDKAPIHARKDSRIRTDDVLEGFNLDGVIFPPEPRAFFYDWIYLTALKEHSEEAKELLNYNAFTDIVFNPAKSKVCQAQACAVYVALVKRGLFEKAMSSLKEFYKIVFEDTKEE